MKKYMAFILAGALGLALLAGCGGDASSASGDGSSTTPSSQTGSSVPDGASGEASQSLPPEGGDGGLEIPPQNAATPNLNRGVTAEHLWLDLRTDIDAAYWHTAEGALCVFELADGAFRAQIEGRSGALDGDVTQSGGAYYFSVAFDGDGEEAVSTPYVVAFREDGGIALAQATSSANAPVYYYSGKTAEQAASPGTD